MALFTNDNPYLFYSNQGWRYSPTANPYRRHLQNDMPIRESSIKCIDFTNNSRISFCIA